ncbi:MAG TPA: CPBP family intramembrane glutamic endopeptidase [Longimicrobiales bacterium]|nr:CPBP family intramembrane glutamic endopeptidase [Longimicrobiales bacterium]
MRPGPRLVSPWRSVLWLVTPLFAAVQLALPLGFGVPWLDATLLSVLLVALPGLALAQLALLGTVRIERIPVYWSSIATLCLVGGASWVVGTRAGGPGAIGLVVPTPRELVVWSSGLTLAGLVTIVAFRELATAARIAETPVLRDLLPRDGRERGVFALLAVAAGLGEELAYRGYALSALAPLLGAPGAAVLTSVVFGILHGYQGLLGTVRTGVMGGLLAWGFLASGSLWPAIVAHTLIDLVAGIVLGERLLSTDVSTARKADPRPSESRDS